MFSKKYDDGLLIFMDFFGKRTIETILYICSKYLYLGVDIIYDAYIRYIYE